MNNTTSTDTIPLPLTPATLAAQLGIPTDSPAPTPPEQPAEAPATRPASAPASATVHRPLDVTVDESEDRWNRQRPYTDVIDGTTIEHF